MRIMLRAYRYKAGFFHVIDKVMHIHLGEPSVETVSQVLDCKHYKILPSRVVTDLCAILSQSNCRIRLYSLQFPVKITLAQQGSSNQIYITEY